MKTRTRLIPTGQQLLTASLFFWLTFTASVIVFTFLATLLSVNQVSFLWSFLLALFVSCLFLLAVYIYRFPLSYSARMRYKQPEAMAKQMLELVKTQQETLDLLREQAARAPGSRERERKLLEHVERMAQTARTVNKMLEVMKTLDLLREQRAMTLSPVEMRSLEKQIEGLESQVQALDDELEKVELRLRTQT